MRRRVRTAFAFATCLVAAAPAAAQSLGDVARAEEARRVTAKKAVKSFSNSDLAPGEVEDPKTAPAPAAANASPAATATPAAPATSAAEPNSTPAPVESEWRGNAESLRKQMQKARDEHDKLTSVIDDESRLPSDRASAGRLAAHQLKHLERLEGRWLRFVKDAEKLNVPQGWLQPFPILSMRIPQ